MWYTFRMVFQVSEKKIRVVLLFCTVAFCLCTSSAKSKESADAQTLPADLTAKIPLRPDSAPTGSMFAASVSGMGDSGREQVIETQLIQGNIPGFLRRLKPVQLTRKFDDGKTVTATVFAMPDYLSVGSDRDFLHVPMNLYTARETATRLGFALPTKRIVDAIYRQAEVRCAPAPLPAGPQMRSTGYYVAHDKKIKEQFAALGCAPGALVSGHKKDVVLTNRLVDHQGKIAIYGWHLPSGKPIQPLSTIHGAKYADYSHGIRLVSEVVLIDGQPRSLYDILEDPKLACLLSDEGAMPEVRRFMGREQKQPVRHARLSPRN
jgi:hypothetical protein